MDSRARLIETILQKSYREGEFTLSSGLKSNFYIDLKATTLSAEGALLIGEVSIQELREAKILDQIVGVGGLTLGADPIATAISLASLRADDLRAGIPAFIVRKETKGHGTSRWIEGVENLRPGGGVVVVEDVSTTGKSAIQAVERVQAAGFRVLAVLTVVDREQGASAFFQERGIPFLSLAKLSDLKSQYRA
ncbi:MAG: hypothetical protein RJB38_1626 [Pseudomonadota bacterium]|jgi:orotate phosphoribosyltransferase